MTIKRQIKRLSQPQIRLNISIDEDEKLQCMADALNYTNPGKVTTKTSLIKQIITAFIKDNCGE